MKIKLICIGKTGKSFLVDGENEYLKRLKHYVQTEKVEIPDLKNQKNLSIEQIKHLEGKEIMAKIGQSEQVYLFDELGKQHTSTQFSEFLQQSFNKGGQYLTFVIGGAYGFSDEVYALANGKLALSKMTFSHQMVRMIALEQIYRALTILKGEPYHHQ